MCHTGRGYHINVAKEFLMQILNFYQNLMMHRSKQTVRTCYVNKFIKKRFVCVVRYDIIIAEHYSSLGFPGIRVFNYLSLVSKYAFIIALSTVVHQ